MTRPTMDEILPDHCSKDVVVLCCGNVLFGDDGFGPAVAERINATESVPDWAVVIDAGTAVRELLFDMILSERRPRLVVVVDAVDLGRTPGEVFEIPLNDIPRIKVSEFSLHQAPTSNLLQELQEVATVRVAVIACQVESIPEEMSEDISSAVQSAIDRAARLIAETYLREPALAETTST
ncbi:hydrogenase maturation protease [Candidatus Bipolaricaulota bacterium]|nr:hydrogenase maturation protease [Candidatus Bipolaricaulota bacterium]